MKGKSQTLNTNATLFLQPDSGVLIIKAAFAQPQHIIMQISFPEPLDFSLYQDTTLLP